MLHPLARITSAYRFNLGWDALTGGLLTRMFPRGCSPCIRIVVISSTCLAMLSYLLWYVIFTLGLWPWLVLYVVSCTSVFLFLNAPMWAKPPLSRGLFPFYQVLSMLCFRWQLLGVYPWHFGTWVRPFILVRLVKAFITVTHGRTYWRPIFYLWNYYHFLPLDEYQTPGSTSIICQL